MTGAAHSEGIRFFYSFDPGSFDGNITFVQVDFNPNDNLQDSASVWHKRTGYTVGPYLDTRDPYDATDEDGNYADSPDVNLWKIPTYLRANASDSFEMSMMFVPPGGHRVPLRAVNWRWSGSATNSPSGWGLSSGDNSPNPTSFETETYPLWNDNVTHCYYVPPLP